MRPTITKNCEWCGTEFTQERKRKPRFCGRRCAALWRSSCRFPVRGAKKCEWCGSEFPRRQDIHTRFCCRKCAFAWRSVHAVFSDETRRKRAEWMRELMKRPDVQAKLMAHRTSDRSPVKLPENRRKLIENQRTKGFPNLKYDGGPTIPQKLLFDHLPGATMEFALSRGKGKSGAWRIDIAIPTLKLAIEVDGLSHVKKKEKKRDAKKEQALLEHGWTLLRFWNGEILGDLPSVLARIQSTIATLKGAA